MLKLVLQIIIMTTDGSVNVKGKYVESSQFAYIVTYEVFRTADNAVHEPHLLILAVQRTDVWRLQP